MSDFFLKLNINGFLTRKNLIKIANYGIILLGVGKLIIYSEKIGNMGMTVAPAQE